MRIALGTVAKLAIPAYIRGMTSIAPDWTTTRKRSVRVCVPLLAALAAAQVTLSWGPALPRLVGGLAYALVCLGAIWVLLERAELVRNTAPLRWKILTWAVCGAAAFAMVGHLLFGSKLEQALLGGGCAIVAVMTLFVAFSPDDADMIDNAQMTRPSEP
jgi:hypothetical protein